MPVAFAHREVWIKGFVDRVVIGCAAEVIAQHPRSYETGDIAFNPVHYLRLIERKIMAFDQAAPLQTGICQKRSSRSSGCLRRGKAKLGNGNTFRFYACWNVLSWMCCPSPSRTRCGWEPSASMLSNTFCYVALNGDRRGWIWGSSQQRYET